MILLLQLFSDEEIVVDFCLSKHIKNKNAILFFYPLDFTFVCPTELISLNNRINEFAKRGIEVIGISVDSQFSHYKWRNTSVNDGGISEVSYTLVSDSKKSISREHVIILMIYCTSSIDK